MIYPNQWLLHTFIHVEKRKKRMAKWIIEWIYLINALQFTVYMKYMGYVMAVNRIPVTFLKWITLAFCVVVILKHQQQQQKIKWVSVIVWPPLTHKWQLVTCIHFIISLQQHQRISKSAEPIDEHVIAVLDNTDKRMLNKMEIVVNVLIHFFVSPSGDGRSRAYHSLYENTLKSVHRTSSISILILLFYLIHFLGAYWGLCLCFCLSVGILPLDVQKWLLFSILFLFLFNVLS